MACAACAKFRFSLAPEEKPCLMLGMRFYRFAALVLLEACTHGISPNETEMRARLESVFLLRSLAASAAVICRNQGYCITFRTAATFAGTGVLGVSGADSKCNADANKPSNTGTYKALIGDTVLTRRACSSANCATLGAAEHIDWVLYANTEYRRVNQTTVIFTTDANGIFVFGTSSAGWDGTGSSYNTGLSGDWTTNASTCTSWTAGGGSGMQGLGNSTGTAMLANGAIGCASTVSLVCVQQ